MLQYLRVVAASLAASVVVSGVAVAEPQRLELARSDKSIIHWALDMPEAGEPRGVIVLAQGSGCLSVEHNANLAHIRSAFPAFAALTVEKYGVKPGDNPTADHEDCSEEFRQHHTMTQRVEDYLAVLSKLRTESWWNGRLVLAGGSEGGDVIARLSAPAKADATILISTGGGKTFGEMVRQSIMDEMERHKVPEANWPPVDQVFERARANPMSAEIWAGSSFRFWADAIDHRILDSMLRADTDFLLIQGGRDTSTPVEMARIVTDRFSEAGRCNLTYWEFPGLDHGMTDMAGTSRMSEVFATAALWAEQQLSSNAASCSRP